jgi:8-oxo-dGTP diphosphatase
MEEAPKTFYAGGFLYNPATDSVLLHLRDGNTPYSPNMWAFFGGGSEGTETPRECFRRELKEETGLDIDDATLRPLCDYFYERLQTHRHVFSALSDVDPATLKLGEGAGMAWIPIARLSEYPLTEPTKNDLEYFCTTVKASLHG